MNRLPPSMTYSSPSRTARVRSPDGSEPASASVRANAMSLSPDASPGSQRSCCSGVPATWIGIAPSDCTARMRPVVAQARLSCSMARHSVSRSAPRPPWRSANGIARMSWLARRRRMSSGHSADRSISAARGATCSSASSRTASRSRTWSSVSRTEPWAGVWVVTATHPSSAGGARSSGMTGPVARTRLSRPQARRHRPPGERTSAPGGTAWTSRTCSCSASRSWSRSPRRLGSARGCRPSTPASSTAESPFAVSTEGEKVCPKCGMGNLWTESRCISCGGALKG